MLRNYLRVAARTLTRQKGYTLINVFGLSVGIACCLLIGRWVQFELSYDEFHAGADRTFRVIKSTGDGWENRVGGALAPLMSENLSAVEKTVQLTRDGDMSLSRAGRSQAGPPKRFKEPSFVFADSAFFDVFDFPLAAGNPDAALSRPGTVVLTSDMATKYFGTEDPVGQTLTLHANVYGESAERTLTVTGVLKTLPENTHLAFDFLASMATFQTNRRLAGGGAVSRLRLAEHLHLRAPWGVGLRQSGRRASGEAYRASRRRPGGNHELHRPAPADHGHPPPGSRRRSSRARKPDHRLHFLRHRGVHSSFGVHQLHQSLDGRRPCPCE